MDKFLHLLCSIALLGGALCLILNMPSVEEWMKKKKDEKIEKEEYKHFAETWGDQDAPDTLRKMKQKLKDERKRTSSKTSP